MKLQYPLIALAILTAPAAAQAARRTWDPSQVTQRVVMECKVPPSLFTVTKRLDGAARLGLSPSVTTDQEDCIRRTIGNLRLQVQG